MGDHITHRHPGSGFVRPRIVASLGGFENVLHPDPAQSKGLTQLAAVGDLGDEAVAVTAHDRTILERSQDLRRWVRDSERRRLARRAEITGDNNERNILRSGAHQGGIKIASELFREEWRNQASSVLRDFWGVVDSEGRLHELFRRRAGSYPGLILPADVRDLLEKWRGPIPVPGMDPVALDDPAGMGPEPELAHFEREG